jgi:hypothetical protein
VDEKLQNFEILIGLKKVVLNRWKVKRVELEKVDFLCKFCNHCNQCHEKEIRLVISLKLQRISKSFARMKKKKPNHFN